MNKYIDFISQLAENNRFKRLFLLKTAISSEIFISETVGGTIEKKTVDCIFYQLQHQQRRQQPLLQLSTGLEQ